MRLKSIEKLNFSMYFSLVEQNFVHVLHLSIRQYLQSSEIRLYMDHLGTSCQCFDRHDGKSTILFYSIKR